MEQLVREDCGRQCLNGFLAHGLGAGRRPKPQRSEIGALRTAQCCHENLCIVRFHSLQAHLSQRRVTARQTRNGLVHGFHNSSIWNSRNSSHFELKRECERTKESESNNHKRKQF
jgi:hypothetical protein